MPAGRARPELDPRSRCARPDSHRAGQAHPHETQEVERFRDAGLRVFWIAGKRDMATWGWLTRLVHHWTGIERLIAERGDGPWFYAVNEQSVREMNL